MSETVRQIIMWTAVGLNLGAMCLNVRGMIRGQRIVKKLGELSSKMRKMIEVADEECAKLREMTGPCAMGDTVYSVFDLEDDGNWEISSYVVEGVGRIGDEWYVYNDGTWFEVGCDLCLLSREEAERVLAERKGE